MFTTEGFKAELLYQVEEEVLGTTFYFHLASGANSTSGAVRLAEALVDEFGNLEEAFGTDVEFHGVKTAAIGFGTGWSHELNSFDTGAGSSVALDEIFHVNLTFLSDSSGPQLVTNRNQISGLPEDDVTDNRISNDIETVWLNVMEDWINGSVQAGGFQFLLACYRKSGDEHQFVTAERVKMSPLVGSRIDRIKNRDNRGNKKPTPDPA